MEISVVIPTYNEKDNILPLYERLKEVLERINASYEIIFVDDGSEDSSLELLKELKEKDSALKIVVMERNYGQSAALDAGFREAVGERIISMDGDLQNDPVEIPRLLKELESCDVVCGWRKRRQDSFIKRYASKFANFIRRLILKDKIIDIGCTLRAYRKYTLDKIRLYHGLHRFLPILIQLEGFKVSQIAVRHNPRYRGKSKYNIRRRLVKPLLDTFVVLWMKRNLLKYEKKIL